MDQAMPTMREMKGSLSSRALSIIPTMAAMIAHLKISKALALALLMPYPMVGWPPSIVS